MRKYEIVIIANPDINEETLNGIIEKVSGWITEGKGEVVSVDNWGKKRLAYRIKKQRDGQYLLITANMEPSAIAELDRNLRFVENIMRSLVTLVED